MIKEITVSKEKIKINNFNIIDDCLSDTDCYDTYDEYKIELKVHGKELLINELMEKLKTLDGFNIDEEEIRLMIKLLVSMGTFKMEYKKDGIKKYIRNT
jgi:hypothetical protein